MTTSRPAPPVERSLRVGFVAHLPGLGGGATIWLADFLERMHASSDNGVNPVLLCPADAALAERVRAAGIEVVIVPNPLWVTFGARTHPRTLRGRVATLRSLGDEVRRAVPAVRHAIGEARLDVVVSSTATAPTAALACRLDRVPHAWWLVERIGAEGATTSFMLGPLASQLVMRATGAAVVCNARCVADAYPWTGPRTHVILPGPQMPAGAALGEQMLADPTLRFLMLGRVARVKEIEVAIEALAIARADGCDAHLLIEGPAFDRDYTEWLHSLIRTHGLENDVILDLRLVDSVTSLDNCHAAVACARAEGLGGVGLEAQTRGRPLLAVDAGGFRETVDPGVSGLLFGPGDAAGLAGHMTRLGTDRALLRRLSEGAIPQSRNFDAERQDEQWVDLLKAVARRDRPPMSTSD